MGKDNGLEGTRNKQQWKDQRWRLAGEFVQQPGDANTNTRGMRKQVRRGMRATRDADACDWGCKDVERVGCVPRGMWMCATGDVDACDRGWGCVRRGMRPTKRMRDRGGPENLDICNGLLPSGRSKDVRQMNGIRYILSEGLKKRELRRP